MNKLPTEEIKQVIDVICLLQARESKFREELNFFNTSWNQEEEIPLSIKRSYLLEALRRLDHEVMFLCIDVYSLYQGVQKKKSLCAREIKNDGKAFMKVDKSTIDPKATIYLGHFNSGGRREPSDEEKEEHRQTLSEKALKAREEIKDNVGPKSCRHPEIDEWINSFADEETVEKLLNYRKKFAHRLDSLDNLKEELMVSNPSSIEDMLNTVGDLLSSYKSRFQDILIYTTSNCYEGLKIKYTSLAQMKQGKE